MSKNGREDLKIPCDGDEPRPSRVVGGENRALYAYLRPKRDFFLPSQAKAKHPITGLLSTEILDDGA